MRDPRVEVLVQRARVEHERARQLYFRHLDFREVQLDALAMLKALHAVLAPGRSLELVDGSWVDEAGDGIVIVERVFLPLPTPLADTYYTLVVDEVSVSTMMSAHRVLTNISVTITGDTADVVLDLVLAHTERAGLMMVA